MEPAMANNEKSGKGRAKGSQREGNTGKSITCSSDLFTCRESVAGNHGTEKSFLCNLSNPKKGLKTQGIQDF
jgi:hypothetical protein